MYPLSTQTLAFIQSQIEQLQSLAQIGGKRYVLKEPANGALGIVVIDGEVLPLAATPTSGKGIKVVEERQDITADGTTYVEARILRSAKYVATYTENTPNLYPASDFASSRPTRHCSRLSTISKSRARTYRLVFLCVRVYLVVCNLMRHQGMNDCTARKDLR